MGLSKTHESEGVSMHKHILCFYSILAYHASTL